MLNAIVTAVAIVVTPLLQGPVVPVAPDTLVIVVDTPEGVVRLVGPGAEWLLETGFPIVTSVD